MLNSFADVVLVSADAVGSEGVTEGWRVFCPVSPDARYVFDLVLGHGGVEVGDARVEVDEAVEGHPDGDQEACEGESLHVTGAPTREEPLHAVSGCREGKPR